MNSEPKSNAAKLSIGQQVVWHYQPPGGLGYEITAPAKVIKIGEAKVQIEVANSEGLLVKRWVPMNSLAACDPSVAKDVPRSATGIQGKAQTEHPQTGLAASRHSSLITREGTQPFLGSSVLQFATRLELPKDTIRRKKKRNAAEPEAPPKALSDEQLREEAAWRQVQETGKPVIFEGILLLPPNLSLWDAIELLPNDIRDQTRAVAQSGAAEIAMTMINHLRVEIGEHVKQSGDLEKWNSFSHATQMAIAESVFRQQYGWPEEPLEELLEQYGERVAHKNKGEAPPDKATK